MPSKISLDSFRQLTPREIVTMGANLYRERLKLYLSLTVKACLWGLIPIYGWVKFTEIVTLISQIAWQDLQEQPANLRELFQVIKAHKRDFFALGTGATLAGLILILSLYALLVGIFIFLGQGLNFLFSPRLSSRFRTEVINSLSISFAIAAIAGIVFTVIGWIYSRLIFVELCLTIEPHSNLRGAMQRSWHLTKNQIKKLNLVASLYMLICMPLIIAVEVAIIFLVVGLVFLSTSLLGLSYRTLISYLGYISTLAIFAFYICSGLIAIPLWQTTKTVFYFERINLTLDVATSSQSSIDNEFEEI